MRTWVLLFSILSFAATSLIAGTVADNFEVDHDNVADGSANAMSAASRAASKAIVSGESQNHNLHVGGNITNGADRDYVRFTLTVASDVLFQTDRTANTVGDADTILRIFTSSGVLIGFDDDGNPAGDLTSRILMINLSPGTYYCSVEAFGFTNGNASVVTDYRLTYAATATGGTFAPLILSALQDRSVVGAQYTYTISSLVTEGTAFVADNLPEGLSVSGNQIVGFPKTAGTFSIAITASTATASDTKTLSLVVDAFGVVQILAGPPRVFSVKAPQGLAVDASGHVFFCEPDDAVVRRLDAFTGVITTIAGKAGVIDLDDNADGIPVGDGGLAVNALLTTPSDLAIDSSGNIYILDTGFGVIRRIAPNGMISTVAGTGVFDETGNGGPATAAAIDPTGPIAVDAEGNVYFGQLDQVTFGSVVRKITVATGVISRVAGSGALSSTGDGGPPLSASFRFISGLALDSAGSMYISDQTGFQIRKITAAGAVSTFAGTGVAGFTGDGGLATAAQLSSPGEVVVDSAGNVFVADAAFIIRKIGTNNIITSITSPTVINAVDGIAAFGFGFNSLNGLAVDPSTQALIAADFGPPPLLVKLAAASQPAARGPFQLTATKDQPLQQPFRIGASGHPHVQFTVGSTPLPAGLSLSSRESAISGKPMQTGATDVELVATNAVGTSKSLLRVIVNGPAPATPMMFSDSPQIIVTPNPARVGFPVTFTAPVASGGNDSKAYRWSFGDSANTAQASGQSVQRIFTAKGVYTVTCEVTDGASTQVLTAAVGVNDTDVTEDLIVSKLQIKFKSFTATSNGNGSITFSGSVPVRSPYTPSTTKIEIDLGGVIDRRTYSLNLKGLGLIGDKKAGDKFTLKAKAGNFIDEKSKFLSGKFAQSIKLTNFTNQAKALGFVANVTNLKVIKLPVLIKVNDDSYSDTLTILFKSSAKGGSGIKLKEGGSFRNAKG